MADLAVGVLGCGHISAAHIRAWQRADSFRVQSVFDVNPELAHRRARQFGIPSVASDVDALLAACDVVDICTPPHTHAQLVQQALSAGRHVLVEKPVVISPSEWSPLLNLARVGGQSLGVVHNLKYTRAVQQARYWLEHGRIGPPVRFERHFLTSPQTDRMLRGDHWSHHLPGGRWYETLPHELYLIYYLMGPMQLAAVSALRTQDCPPGVPADEVTVTLKDGHRLASLHYSANCDANRRPLTIYGRRGVIAIEMLSDFAALTTLADRRYRRALSVPGLEAAVTLLRAVPDRTGYLLDRARGETPHSRLIRAFGAHVHGRGPSPSPLHEIDYVVHTADAIARAIDSAAAGSGPSDKV
jgi:predicted dehydrogenase